jgi:hypothetical protein
MDALVAGNQRVRIRSRVVGADAGARLHLAIADALVYEALLDDKIGRVERGPHRRGIAEILVERDVVRCARPDRFGAVGLSYVGDCAQYLVFDLDRLTCIARLEQSFRDHHRDGLAGIAHAVDHQRILWLLQHRAFFRRECADLDIDRAGRIGALDRALQAIGDVVGPRQHRDHPRHCSRGTRVDPLHQRMRVRRAHERGDRLSGHRNVVGIFPGPADEAKILEPRHRPADIGAAFGPRFAIHTLGFSVVVVPSGRLSNGPDASATGWTRGGKLCKSVPGEHR